MSVPSRTAAAKILLDLEPPGWLVRHSAAVAEIATYLAQRIVARGTAVEEPLVEAAALLHDLDKALPSEHELRALGHAAAGAEWLRRAGHGEIAAAVAGHPATLLSDERRYHRWAATASLEERVVAYADKRAEQDVVSLDQRFASWRERHPEFIESVDIGLERARLLEGEVCTAAGIDPAEVSRVAWFAAAAGMSSGSARSS